MSINVWNADVYDDKLRYVSRYGKGIVELLQPKQGEEILDLGCGTGDLTEEIAKSGAVVTGIDASSEMIKKARAKFPGLNFQVADAVDYRREEKFDAVFSNAALHWITQAEKVVETIEKILKPNGRFVAEFGGSGNVMRIIRGIEEVLQENYGIDSVDTRNPWYFPSIGEYTSLLEKHGFTVTFANLFDRPTTLPDGEKGLEYWLDSFADDFFPEFFKKDRTVIYHEIVQKLKNELYKEGNWVADYKRLQVIAIKN